jgi:hypothetical protein
MDRMTFPQYRSQVERGLIREVGLMWMEQQRLSDDVTLSLWYAGEVPAADAVRMMTAEFVDRAERSLEAHR